jgi:hypothetical protein
MAGSAHTFVRSNVAGSAPEHVGPSSWTTWLAAQTYAVGAYVVPPIANGYYYECTASSGPTGGAPPVFPTPTGTTVVDGGATWTCRYTTAVLVAEFEAWEQQLKWLINATDGGCTVAPTSPIIIGGQGLLVHPGSPTQVCRGGSLEIEQTGGILLDATDWPNYIPSVSGAPHPGSTRVVCYSCAEGLGHPTYMWRVRWSDGGMQAVAGSVNLDGGTHFAILRVPLRSHDGATLSSATLYFRIGFAHSSVPGTPPKVRIVRVDAAGNVTPLTSQAAGGDPNGFVTATAPSSASTWTGNQQITVACDQNNVVDLATSTLYAEIIEEQTPGYPWQLTCLDPVKAVRVVTSPTQQLTNGGTFDGVTCGTGDRVLVLFVGGAAAYAFRSGVYLVNSSPTGWARAPDFAQASDFSQGMFVRVQQGSNAACATLQIASTQDSWDPGSDPLPGNAQQWQASFGYANANPYVPQAMLPSTPNGFFYMNTQSYGGGSDGLKNISSGLTEPDWPTVVGDTVIDGPAWQASTAYGANAQVVSSNGFLFVNYGSPGTSGSSQPANWPTTFGAMQTDGSVTWTNQGSPMLLTCMGTTGDDITFVGRPDPDDEVSGIAGSAFFCHGNAYDCVQVTYTNIENGRFA